MRSRGPSAAWMSRSTGRLLEVVVGTLVAVAVVAVFLQVAFRYLLAIPLHWTEELARYLTVWLVLLGSALGVRSGTHFRFVFLTLGLPPRLHSVLEYLIDGLSAVFFVLFLIAA